MARVKLKVAPSMVLQRRPLSPYPARYRPILCAFAAVTVNANRFNPSFYFMTSDLSRGEAQDKKVLHREGEGGKFSVTR